MRYRNFFTLLVAVVLLALGSSRVHAATFTVSNLNDSGEGSLRQAILDANAAPGPDVIAFQAGLTGTIPLTSGELDITGDLEIQGPGPAALAVDGGLRSRLLVIERGVTAAVSSLTFRNGRPGFFDGGGIWNDGSLTLNGCTVSGNRTAGRGGGILNIGSLTLT
ncbi:MAG: hypothetical protein HY320_12305, partial [Armatimonadetes bacterium]|nr:hypothetical protein [Armatimonadota bacterium]